MPRHWTYLAIISLICSLLFIRIYNAPNVFMLQNEGDDAGYFAHTEALLRNHTFDWCAKPIYSRQLKSLCTDPKTGLPAPNPYNKFTPGGPLLILPFTALGWLLNELGLFTVAPLDPLLLWSAVGSFFAFFLGVLFLYESAVLITRDRRTALWTTLCFAVGNPVLYYVFRRPLLVHSMEFFLTYASVYCVIRWWLASDRRVVWAGLLGLASGWLAITRINDALVIVIWGVVLLFANLRRPRSERLRSAVVFGAAAGLPILVLCLFNGLQSGHFLYNPANYNRSEPAGELLENLFTVPPRNFRRILDFFVGVHWGMFWVMPFLLVEVAAIVRCFKSLRAAASKHRLMSGLIAFVILFQLNFQANFPSNGMSYANRYLFTVFFLMHVLFLIAIRGGLKLGHSRAMVAVAAISVLLGSLNILNFESNSTTLTLHMGTLGEEGIYDPRFSDLKFIVAPYYAMHSLKHDLSGKALANLGATPLVAYPYFALKASGLQHIPGRAKLAEYYESPKRQVYGLGDLGILFRYHVALCLVLALMAAIFRLKPSCIFPGRGYISNAYAPDAKKTGRSRR